MFKLKDVLQDDVDETGTPGPGPGETGAKLDEIDEKDRGDEVSAAVAAKPEDDAGDKPAKTAAELGADEIEKAEKKALGEGDDEATKKAAEEEAAKATAKAPSGKQVPKHRLDAVQAARRVAEARAAKAEAALQELQELQNQTPPPAAAAVAAAATVPATALDDQINALDKKIDDLTEEGKADEAREARRDLRKLERQQLTEEAQASAQAVATESVQQTDLRTAIENIEDAIPALNPDNTETFDSDLSDNVNELADAFEASGHPPAAALYKAIEFAIPATADEETDADGLPVDEQVEKNIDTAMRQPSKLSDASKASLDSNKAGLRPGKTDVMEMSEKRFDEFVADEEQEKIARGDFVGA